MLKLNASNYYSLEANREFFSASQVKNFMACEARAMAELAGEYVREKTPALLVGGYVDAHFSGELEQFKAENPEIFTKKGELRSDFQQAEEIIRRLEADPLAMRMLAGEKQQILVGTIEGHPFKAKLDVWLNAERVQLIAKDFPQMDELLFARGAIVDLKIMKDFAPQYKDGAGRLSFVELWDYDLQLAIYQALKAQQSGINAPCYILGATKQPVTGLGLFQVEQAEMDVQMQLLARSIHHMADVKAGKIAPERCEACEYCRATKRLSGPEMLEV